MRTGRLAGSLFLAVLSLGLLATEGQTQQLILKGEFGLKAGSQPPPGIYVGGFGANNLSSEFAAPDGTTLSGPTFNQWIVGGLVMGTTKLKVLGANYGFILGVPFANLNSDFPRLGADTSSGMALSQLWVVPVSLGWHLKQADVTFHYAFYPPTGRYTPGNADNTGLGMWTNEFSLRGTYFFGDSKLVHASLAAFYDINGKKDSIDYTQGNPLTLMGGVGASFGDKKSKLAGWAGLVGYAQWQVTNTTGTDVLPPIANNKSQIYALGPELTTLQGALTLRYYKQFGGQYSTVGDTFYAQFVMPVKMF
jgi:hypothetical protein